MQLAQSQSFCNFGNFEHIFQTGWYSEDEGLHLSSSIEGMKLNLFSGGVVGGGGRGEPLNDEADYAERARTNSLNNRAAYARSISQPVLSEVESLDEKDRYSRVPITRRVLCFMYWIQISSHLTHSRKTQSGLNVQGPGV